MGETIQKTHSATPIASETDVKHLPTYGSVDSLNNGFDGTANLTLGRGTILIPAPTSDPRGMRPKLPRKNNPCRGAVMPQ